jgi:hypothetical protein
MPGPGRLLGVSGPAVTCGKHDLKAARRRARPCALLFQVILAYSESDSESPLKFPLGEPRLCLLTLNVGNLNLECPRHSLAAWAWLGAGTAAGSQCRGPGRLHASTPSPLAPAHPSLNQAAVRWAWVSGPSQSRYY